MSSLDQLHPIIRAKIALLAAEADHEIAKLNMRRNSIKGLGMGPGASRMRLTEQAFEQHKIAAGYRYLLAMIDKNEV